MQVIERTFRVRHSECDAYGHVNNAQYVRWMQETAFDASAAAGYDETALAALGTLWLIRETEVEYLAALRHNDRVSVRTWVEDFRRAQSRRRYEMVRVLPDGTPGERVARGHTDWVYIDRASQRPASVPPAMIAGFRPYSMLADDGSDQQPTERTKFPTPPPPPPGAYHWTRTVEWRDLDTAQHVNNATYLNYMEECAFRAAASFGWSLEWMAEHHLAIVARKHRILYENQAKTGDTLRVTTYLDEVKRSTAIRHFTIVRPEADGTYTPITRARSLFVFINTGTGMPMRLLPEWGASFAAHVAGAAD